MNIRIITLLAIAFVHWCSHGFAEQAAPEIIWGETKNGLVLGIEKPASAFIFEPVKEWKGPLVRTTKTATGMEMQSNSAGVWSRAMFLKVVIKNTSDKPIAWSQEHDVWRIELFGESGAVKAEEFPGPRPAPKRLGPVILAPGAQSELLFNIEEAGELWPMVPEGNYTVKVTYSPTDLLKFATGGEGHWIHPYDVPGFWKGSVGTAAVAIAVKYP